jgi:predicted Fe-S protein YdhL (DUF1289 family)
MDLKSKTKFLELSQEEKIDIITKVRFRRRQKLDRPKKLNKSNRPSKLSKPSDPIDSLWSKMTPEQRAQLSQLLKKESPHGNC